MPPAGEERLSPEELDTLQTWIKLDALGINPDHSIQGTSRCVQAEPAPRHHYTILDLLDYDYDTQVHFPRTIPANGFDNIGSLLNTPPMLVEKYLRAANEIVRVVPSASRVVREQTLPAERFFDAERPTDRIVCREPQLVTANFPIDLPGEYLIEAKFQVYGSPLLRLSTDPRRFPGGRGACSSRRLFAAGREASVDRDKGIRQACERGI
ncbi:MAG: DUF1587 domain-containing protein [Pirellulaceae bacterium]